MQITRNIQWIVVALVTSIGWPAFADSVVYRGIEYAKPDNHRLLADIYVPEGEGPFPGVLMVHGGAWMSGHKGHVAGHAHQLMKRGYTVMSINYRLAPKHKFPAQIDDCRTALRWMRQNAKNYHIDTTRIAGFGYSAGGHLVCLLALNQSEHPEEHLQAVVAGGAPCKFENVPPDSPVLAYWLGGTRRELPVVYREASPTTFVGRDDPPVFFFHGEDDLLVRPRSSKALHDLLAENDVRTEFHLVPEAGHLKAFFDRNAPQRAADFLDSVFVEPLDSEREEP